MRAVVTGSSGFIGSHLWRRLRDDGHEVIGIDRRATSGDDEFRMDLADPSNRARLAELVTDVDVVFHLAARPGVRDPHPQIHRLRQRDNIEATRAVLAVTPHTTPVVATSSSSVYGNSVAASGLNRPCRETDRLDPIGGYARSKVAMEAVCAHRIEAGGRTVVARPFTVIGEGQRADMALALWIAAARNDEPIRLLGSPSRSRDVTDVHAVVSALMALSATDFSGVVNVGTGVGRSLGEMAQAVVVALGRPARFQIVDSSPEEPTATLADTDRLRSLIGFAPETDLIDVVARMVAHRPQAVLATAAAMR